MRIFLIISSLCLGNLLFGQKHPNLILTKSGVESMRSSLGSVALFDKSYQKAKETVDAQMAKGIEVPFPKDLAGGYTHSQHKVNYFTMQRAGVLFQISREEKYAIYIRDMLLKYAEVFPKFESHPEKRSYATGKFFWQCLNDANWLVYASQAYDAIYDWLDKASVKKLNTELFRPYAEFISIESPQFFNRIHNHSTWANAAVGMVALVIEDQELLRWSLYGLDGENLKLKGKDNDGGKIISEEQKEAGFYAQLNYSFSPEGYYTEGPYYQRYAIYPFLIYSQALQNNKPEINIIHYRNDMLIKAVYTLIELSNSSNEFFPINDAQKGMSLSSRELVTAIGMAYFYGENDPKLLSLIEEQGRVSLNEAGLLAALAIEQGKARKYSKSSQLFFDGKDGNEGAISILRSQNNSDITLLLKYAKHGMGHGHFDALGFLLYHGENEVFQDYGSARWVNIKHKDGGGYLKENKTWAKQTIAHNSIVINQKSQFKANVEIADANPGRHILFDTLRSDIQIVSAEENKAYPGWSLKRTMALLEIPELENSLVLDVVDVNAKEDDNSENTIQLPLYYRGELMSTNIEKQAAENLKPLGNDFGYQHLWKEGESVVNLENNFQMTWFLGSSFYSLRSTVQKGDRIDFTRIGANDPNFNLRRDPGLLLNRKTSNTVFALVYESHGDYNRSTEIPEKPFSEVKNLSIVLESMAYIAIEIELISGVKYLFCMDRKMKQKGKHSIKVNGGEIRWDGAYYFSKI